MLFIYLYLLGWYLFCLSAIESARIRAGGAARSATNSPTQSAGPGRTETAIVEEEEITLSIPKSNRTLAKSPSMTKTTTTTTSNGDVDVKGVGRESSVQQSPTPHNGAAMAPLASVEDVTDSVVPGPVVSSAIQDTSVTALRAETVESPSNSRSPSRDNPLLIRFRQWTDRFSLNPLRSASAEPPVNNQTSGSTPSTPSRRSGSPSGGDGPKSPKLGGSRKVSHNLSRFFSRSCSRGGGGGGGGQQSACPSPEPNQQRPSSTCGSSRPSRTTEISRKMSNSLDNVQAHSTTTDSTTNQPPQNA